MRSIISVFTNEFYRTRGLNVTIEIKFDPVEPGCWQNGNAFVFCPNDCPFKSKPSPTSTHACGEVTGCAPVTKRPACVAPEVDSGNAHYTGLHKKVNKAEPTLALKPRGDVTRNPKRGTSGPQKGHMSAKNFKKKFDPVN